MDVQNINRVPAFTTKDGSEIRELLAHRNSCIRNQTLAEARLPAGKTLENFDFNAVPMLSKAQVKTLCAGDAWLEQGANVMLFGPPGGGKSQVSRYP